MCFFDSVSFSLSLYCRLIPLCLCLSLGMMFLLLCGCCTLPLEDGLVADGDDDGVAVPVGTAELYSAEQLFPLITLAGLMSLLDVVACLGFAIKVVVNVCKFRLHFLHSCSCFLLSGFHHVGWLDVWPRRCGACFALPSCSIFHSLVMEGLHTSFIDFMYFLFT